MFMSFWEAEEETPLVPQHSAVFVMRNGRYEPQNLMPMLPRPDILDFDGFVERRGMSRGYAAPPPPVKQASLVKNSVSVRRDTAKAKGRFNNTPTAEGSCCAAETPEQTGLEGASNDKSLVTVSFTFDAIRSGTLTLHLLAEEREYSPAIAKEAPASASHTEATGSASSSQSSGERIIELLPRGAGTAAEVGVSTAKGAAEKMLPPVRVPAPGARCLAFDTRRFDSGIGQIYESPVLDVGGWAAENLTFDPARPKDIPIAVRLEPDPSEGEELSVHFTYISLQRIQRPGGNQVCVDSSHAEVMQPSSEPPQWTAHIFVQKMQFGLQTFVLHDVFGVSSRQASDADDVNGGNSDCVICLSEPRDTAVLPCRHMCFCSYCAGIVRLQCDKCPVCRQKVESLLQFKRLGFPSQEDLLRGADAAEAPTVVDATRMDDPPAAPAPPPHKTPQIPAAATAGSGDEDDGAGLGFGRRRGSPVVFPPMAPVAAAARVDDDSAAGVGAGRGSF